MSQPDTNPDHDRHTHLRRHAPPDAQAAGEWHPPSRTQGRVRRSLRALVGANHGVTAVSDPALVQSGSAQPADPRRHHPMTGSGRQRCCAARLGGCRNCGGVAVAPGRSRTPRPGRLVRGRAGYRPGWDEPPGAGTDRRRLARSAVHADPAGTLARAGPSGVTAAGVVANVPNSPPAHVGNDVIVTLPDGILILSGSITIESAAFEFATGLGLAAAILAVAPPLVPRRTTCSTPSGGPRTERGCWWPRPSPTWSRLSDGATGVMRRSGFGGHRSRGPESWREIRPGDPDRDRELAAVGRGAGGALSGSGRRSRWEPAGIGRPRSIDHRLGGGCSRWPSRPD